MDSKLIAGILSLCKVLNKHEVHYMFVGGIAVAVGLHSDFRNSINLWGIATEKHDLDFWYDLTYKNYFKLLNALEKLGQDVMKFKEEQIPNPAKSFFKYTFDDFTFDLLPALKVSLSFGAAFRRKEEITLDEGAIFYISLDDLIADKEANARPKDISDIEQLKAKRKSNKA